MSQMLTYVVESLKHCDVEEVERATGISAWTLRKIRIEQIKNPGVRSIEPLYKYFKNKEGAILRRKGA